MVRSSGFNLALYNADGTVTVAFPSPTPAAPRADHALEFFSPALGAWVATGERRAVQRFVSLAVDEQGRDTGRHTIMAEAAVAPDGQTWHGPFRIDVTTASGTAAGQIAGTVVATRIVPEGPSA